MTLVDALAQVLAVCFTLGSIQCRKVKRLSSALLFAFHHFDIVTAQKAAVAEINARRAHHTACAVEQLHQHDC